MKRNRLLHIESVEVHSIYLQAFNFFLGMIWQDVAIVDIQRSGDGQLSLDLAMPHNIKGELVMHLWEDWKTNLMYSMYAVRN
jgi:hypothetical protein